MVLSLVRDDIDTNGLVEWLARYRQRLRVPVEDESTRAERMNAVNPCFVLRAHLLEKVGSSSW